MWPWAAKHRLTDHGLDTLAPMILTSKLSLWNLLSSLVCMIYAPLTSFYIICSSLQYLTSSKKIWSSSFCSLLQPLFISYFLSLLKAIIVIFSLILLHIKFHIHNHRKIIVLFTFIFMFLYGRWEETRF